MRFALHDDAGQLTLRRLRPWHRMLARCAAARLDRELAAGISPETGAIRTARAVQLTSMKFRRDLATSVQRILAVAAVPAHPPRVPVNRVRIGRAAVPLATLAGLLAGPGPVRVQGAAMVSQLLADGTGPLYHDARGADLAAIIGIAVQVLTP